MSTGQIITLVLLVSAPSVILGYDAWAYLTYGNDATISKTILTWATRFPILGISLVFSTGVLVGHLLVPQHVVEAARAVYRAVRGQ